MASYNKIIFMGHLTLDPVVKPVGSSKVASFSIAANHKYRKADKTLVEDVCFVDVEAWGSDADVASKYLKKGSGVMVEGRLKQNSWKDKSGNDRSKHVISADKILLIDAKPSDSESSTNSIQNNPAYSSTVKEIDKKFGVTKIDTPPSTHNPSSDEAIDDLPF